MIPVDEDNDGYGRTAADTVRRHCDPWQTRTLFHPPEDESNDWHLGSDVQVCIVVGEGDREKIRRNVNIDLALKSINAYVAVYTPEDFEECSSIGGTLANDAVRNGYLACRRGGYRSLRLMRGSPVAVHLDPVPRHGLHAIPGE